MKSRKILIILGVLVITGSGAGMAYWMLNGQKVSLQELKKPQNEELEQVQDEELGQAQDEEIDQGQDEVQGGIDIGNYLSDLEIKYSEYQNAYSSLLEPLSQIGNELQIPDSPQKPVLKAGIELNTEQSIEQEVAALDAYKEEVEVFNRKVEQINKYNFIYGDDSQMIKNGQVIFDFLQPEIGTFVKAYKSKQGNMFVLTTKSLYKNEVKIYDVPQEGVITIDPKQLVIDNQDNWFLYIGKTVYKNGENIYEAPEPIKSLAVNSRGEWYYCDESRKQIMLNGEVEIQTSELIKEIFVSPDDNLWSLGQSGEQVWRSNEIEIIDYNEPIISIKFDADSNIFVVTKKFIYKNHMLIFGNQPMSSFGTGFTIDKNNNWYINSLYEWRLTWYKNGELFLSSTGIRTLLSEIIPYRDLIPIENSEDWFGLSVKFVLFNGFQLIEGPNYLSYLFIDEKPMS